MAKTLPKAKAIELADGTTLNTWQDGYLPLSFMVMPRELLK